MLPLKIKFQYILYLVGVLYFSLSFLGGETFFEMPNDWFITWMANVFQQMDQVGFFNVWSGQSPGFNYLYFILWKPAQALGDGQYYFALVFTLLWGILSIGCLFLSAYLFYKIVEHLWGEERGLILGTIYILLLLTLPKWYEVIDSLTIAGLLAAIYYSLKGKSPLGGVILGLTATLKPLGLMLLPVILKSEFLSLKTRLLTVIASVAAFLGLLLPLAIGNWRIFVSSFNWQSGRPPWESLYAFFLWLTNKPYPTNPLFQDGSGVSDWGKTGITPLPALMTTPVPSNQSWYNALFILLVGLAIVAFLLFKRVRTREELLSGTFCLLGAYLVCFYGWSLQFIFWLVPLMLVSFPLSLTITFRLLVALEYPFFYALYLSRVAPQVISAAPGLTVGMTAALSPIGAQAYWSVIIIRTLFILTLAVLVWRKLPTQLWNPVYEFSRLNLMRQKLQIKT